MVAVRYAALAALVVWIAAMLTLVAGDALARYATPLACGAIVLLGLLVMKFVGPPPRAFIPRIALVGGMLIATVLRIPALTLALGAVLLFWYVYE
jgi:hypothetical protein